MISTARQRIAQATASPTALRRLAVASVVANVSIVVTGGAVRLSGSGLGCPTWPKCEGSSLTPTGGSSYHAAIEFTNRTLTTVLVIVAVATLLFAWRQHRQWPLALLAFGVIPAQIVIGGISVLTDLNPWVVALHLLTSMANIAVTMVLWWRLSGPRHIGRASRPALPLAGLPRAAAWLARAVVGTTGVVLIAGTVVTGSGPHSGAQHASQRIGIRTASVTQLHADIVMVLIGLTVGLIALLYAVRAESTSRHAALWLLGIEAAQAIIGFAQYFTNLPGVLVGVHMLGACTVWIAAVYLLLVIEHDVRTRSTSRSEDTASGLEQAPDRIDEHADKRTDNRSIHSDELQVASDLKL